MVLLILSCGCSKSEQLETFGSSELPKHIKKLDSLTVYQANAQSYDTVEFVREQVFESNENVFINGYTGEVAVDDANNVYVVGQKPGTVGVYVFKPDGSFITDFLREGRGPGEFEAIGSMHIKNNKLYIFGPRLQKVGIFFLDDYSLIDDYKIGREEFENNDSLTTIRATGLNAVNKDGTMLIKFEDNNFSNPNRNERNLYYKLSNQAKVLSDNVLKTKRYKLYQTGMKRTPEGYVVIPFTLPINRNSLTAISDNGIIFTAWTEDFLIKAYDASGNYQRAVYYPYTNRSVNLSELDIREGIDRIVKHKVNFVKQ